jgi:hypothetical protein
VFLVGCRVKKIKQLVGDVPVLAVLVAVIFVALVNAIVLPNVLARSCGLCHPPLSHPHVFGWLLHVKYQTAASEGLHQILFL